MSDKKILRVCSVSGGKDSTALYIWLIQRFGKHGFLSVFADTDNEHPVTKNYVRNMPEMFDGPAIDTVQANFDDLLERKGIAPSGNVFLDMCLYKRRAPSSRAQFCTENLKLAPIKKWLAYKRKDYDEVVMYTGIRKAESKKRSTYLEHDYLRYFDCQTHRPLLNWTEQEVIDFVRSKGALNPLYEAGHKRVGCYPCIHANKTQLRRMEGWAWDKIKDWEDAIGGSWFSAGLVPGANSKFGENVPSVEDVRQWSKTTWGGTEVDLFAELDVIDVPGCMSTWGACE